MWLRCSLVVIAAISVNANPVFWSQHRSAKSNLGATGESALHNYKRPENVPKVLLISIKRCV
jgi:hypothetical protein